jgi:DNA-directed RNA polymerase subunit F
MSNATEIDSDRQIVIRTLLRFHGSMPFLELTSVSDIDDERLDEIVSELQSENLVKVTNAKDVIERIVTLTPQASSQLKRST